MKDKELAKMIVDFIPFWEHPHTNYKYNYKETLQALKDKECTQHIYNYIYNEYETGTTYNTIINELIKRIKGV